MKYHVQPGILTILLILAGLVLPAWLVAEDDQDEDFPPGLQSCDDVRDHLEDYLEQHPEPGQAEVDDLLETLIPACPCDTDVERGIDTGLILLDALLYSGFPVEMSMTAVSRGCDLRASQVAALNQVLSPGIGSNSSGPETTEHVSPN